jgi:methylated-DNA-[protein]-cysteine S-methyltransferase
VSGLAYAEVETPIGRLIAAATDDGLVRLSLPNDSPERVLGGLEERFGSAPTESAEAMADTSRELHEYFAGERDEFTMPLDFALTSGFDRRACEAMARIGYGETITYAELAERAGNRRAARAAGHACATNPIAIVVPCHRVLGSNGSLHGYGGGLDMKRYLLRLEGVLLDT